MEWPLAPCKGDPFQWVQAPPATASAGSHQSSRGGRWASVASQNMFYNRPRNPGFARGCAAKCFTIRGVKSLKLRCGYGSHPFRRSSQKAKYFQCLPGLTCQLWLARWGILMIFHVRSWRVSWLTEPDFSRLMQRILRKGDSERGRQ